MQRSSDVSPSYAMQSTSFDVFKNAVTAIADEMAITILRTAHSQIVADSYDFSAALCDRRGRVVAQANTLPVHLGSIPSAMTAVLRHFSDTLAEGDVYILNDPDDGGMHLPDIFLVRPVFVGQQLLGFSVATANHADVGGWKPGSMAVQSTSIFAEGIQIPPVRLMSREVVDETLRSVILRNVRQPDLLWGDLESQLAACFTGAAGLKRIVGSYGVEEFETLVEALLDYSEDLLRAALADTPDAEATFTDYLDDDGLGSGPIGFSVRLALRGDTLLVDFTGTSDQVDSALNATESFTRSAVYAVAQGLFGAGVPANDGFYRPIECIVPEGTILNPRRPAARGARGIVAFRLIDAMFGAFHELVPGRVPAAGDGGPTPIIIGSHDGAEWIVQWDVLNGAWGARPNQDGIDGTSQLGANIANTPVEELERRGVIRIDGYGFLPDTGGAGVWRGGLSTFRDMTIVAQSASVSIRSDRRRHLPYGLAGGKSGAPSLNILNPGPKEEILPSKTSTEMRAGDRHRHVTAGGGGFGNPHERDPRLVLEDFVDGKVSNSHAREAYCVVIDRDGLNVEGTELLRSEARGQ